MTRLNTAKVEACIQDSGLKLFAIAGKLRMTTRNLHYRRKTGRWTVPQLCQLADMFCMPIASFFTPELPCEGNHEEDKHDTERTRRH